MSKLLHVFALASVFFVASFSGNAQVDSAPRIVDYPSGGVQLGNGWNSAVALKTPSVCIGFSQVDDKASDKTAYIHSVTDKSSLMNELQISAEVQVKAAFASASAKTDFVHTTEIKDEYQNFVVRAVVKNGATYAGPSAAEHKIDLLPAYRALVTNNPAQFFKECGDSYVSAHYGGAELDAVLTFQTRSVDDRRNLKVAVEGSGWGIEAKGSVASALKTYTENHQLTILYHQSGGAGNPIPTNQDGLTKAIQDLPAAAVKAPFMYAIEITRYDSLPSWPAAAGKWQTTALGKLASRYGQLSSLHEQTVSILNDPSGFVLGRGVTIATLTDLEAKLLDHLRNLSNTAKKCMQSGGNTCGIDGVDDIVDYEFRVLLPVPQVSFPEDIAYRKAADDLKSKTDALTKKRADIASISVPFGGKLKPQDVEQLIAPDKAVVKQAQDYLDRLREQYPDATRDAVVKYWIANAVDVRCRADINDPDCISRLEVDKFKAKVPVK